MGRRGVMVGILRPVGVRRGIAEGARDGAAAGAKNLQKGRGRAQPLSVRPHGASQRHNTSWMAHRLLQPAPQGGPPGRAQSPFGASYESHHSRKVPALCQREPQSYQIVQIWGWAVRQRPGAPWTGQVVDG